MTWVGIALIAIGVYFAFKVVKLMFKLLWWSLVLAVAYWFFAPMLGLPSLQSVLGL